MKWYQFHLSTVLFVTLVASGLLGVNLTPVRDTHVKYTAEVLDPCALPIR